MSDISRTQVALEALSTGADMDEALASVEAGTEEEVSPSVEESTTEESSQPEIQEESQELADSEEVAESDEVPASNELPDVEEIVVNGKKLKVDYNDRDKLKKYIQMAGGARKWQAAKDAEVAAHAATRAQLEEAQQFESTIEQAYAKNGIQGLAEVVAGGPEEFQQWMDSEYERRRAKEDATPAQLERIELEEKLERERRERELLAEQIESNKTETQKRKEAAEIAELTNLVTPAFNKYSFAGKLGDESAEQTVNQMVWNQAMAALKNLPEEVNLDSKIVDREFRKAANTLRKVTTREAKKKVSSAIQNKKREAATKAAISAGKGPANQDNDTQMRDSLKKGDLRSALSAFLKN